MVTSVCANVSAYKVLLARLFPLDFNATLTKFQNRSIKYFLKDALMLVSRIFC